MSNTRKRILIAIAASIICGIILSGCATNPFAQPPAPTVDIQPSIRPDTAVTETEKPRSNYTESVLDKALFEREISELTPSVELNGNIPTFTEAEKGMTHEFKQYSELDALGRCGVAFVGLSRASIPDEPRGEIGMVKPSGWKTIRLDFVDGGYLYNRCHLVGYQLAGDNADPRNLITGTRYLNVVGMLEYENMVGDYLYKTENHVLYRVTPIYRSENDLVAWGVQMEGYSIEDGGEGICFNVFCPNYQPGVSIDYATGEATVDETRAKKQDPEATPDPALPTYVVNSRSKKFHIPTCEKVNDIAEYNRHTVSATREDLIADGYDPCGFCKP